MNRRSFLRTSSAAAAGLLIPSDIFGKEPKVSYSSAIADPDLRQNFLDHTYDDSGNFLKYVKKLTYQDDPLSFAVMNIINVMSSASDSGVAEVYIDSDKLRNAFTYVFIGLEDYGKGEKSEVFVFSKPFKELWEGELRVCLQHENVHCMDAFQGIVFGENIADPSLLENDVLNGIMELRAYYMNMKEFYRAYSALGEELFDNVRLTFIDNMEDEYISNYSFLNGRLNEGIGVYSSAVVRDHLRELGGFMPPDMRYDK